MYDKCSKCNSTDIEYKKSKLEVMPRPMQATCLSCGHSEIVRRGQYPAELDLKIDTLLTLDQTVKLAKKAQSIGKLDEFLEYWWMQVSNTEKFKPSQWNKYPIDLYGFDVTILHNCFRVIVNMYGTFAHPKYSVKLFMNPAGPTRIKAEAENISQIEIPLVIQRIKEYCFAWIQYLVTE